MKSNIQLLSHKIVIMESEVLTKSNNLKVKILCLGLGIA